MDEVIVEVNSLRKVYGSKVAVDGISFNVNQGEIFGLLGPNGAGKTSTLECLEGIRFPDGGSIRIDGIDPIQEPGRLRQVIGVQLQSAALPGTMTPRESMIFFCSYHQVPPRFDLLDRFGLTDQSNTQYSHLSAGQQRRLTLALAFAGDPRVLFLDEPTAGLDVPSRAELHRLIRELQQKGVSILLATHDMAEAEVLTDRVAILLNGTISAVGTPMEITATGSGLTKISVKTSLGSLLKTGLSFPSVSQSAVRDDYSVFYSTDIGSTIPALITYLEKSEDSLIDLRVQRPSLEDRFLEITA